MRNSMRRTETQKYEVDHYPTAYRLPRTAYRLPRFRGVHAGMVSVLGFVDPPHIGLCGGGRVTPLRYNITTRFQSNKCKYLA